MRIFFAHIEQGDFTPGEQRFAHVFISALGI
jgi:hypothetical protein